MNRKPSKVLSAIVIALISAGLMMSTLAMTPNQGVATTTLEPSQTITLTATSTATATPTFTPSPSATLTQTPTETVPKPLQTEFAAVNKKLDDLQPNSTSKTIDAIESFVINLVSGAFWDFVKWFFAFSGLAAAISKFINNQAKSVGETPNRILANLEIFFVDVFKIFLWLVIGIIVIWGVYYLGDSIRQSSNRSQLIAVSNKLDQIQMQIQTISPVTPNIGPSAVFSFPTNTPTPTKTVLQIPALVSSVASYGISIVIMILFFLVAVVISRNQTSFYENILPRIKSNQLGRKLFPTVFIVLVLYLLPDPIEAFLTPIVVPYIIYAFFDVVLLYPNFQLQDIVIKHYPKIIFLSVFGVWLRAFQVLQNYFRPFWSISGGRLNQTLWDLLPFILAILYALYPSRQIRKISEDKYISKIIDARKNKTNKRKTKT